MCAADAAERQRGGDGVVGAGVSRTMCRVLATSTRDADVNASGCLRREHPAQTSDFRLHSRMATVHATYAPDQASQFSRSDSALSRTSTLSLHCLMILPE